MNKTLLFALAGVALLAATAVLTAKTNLRQDDAKITQQVIDQWKMYKSKFGKKFSDPDMEVYRMEIFANNLETISNDKTGTLGITFFADLSQEEFTATYLTLKPENKVKDVDTFSSINVGSVNVNWVNAGAVTAVKNQGRCGSCWAFSATGSLESALILGNQANNSLDLSEQQLVDCSLLNNGCDGGMMDRAFYYVLFHGLTTDANYPYHAVDQTCQKQSADLYHLKGWVNVESGSVDSLSAALVSTPVSVAVDASNWSLYTNGVFSNCGNSLNHGVLLAGQQDGVWLVKNSWGTSWGESGYIRLAPGNTCGIADVASYPVV